MSGTIECIKEAVSHSKFKVEWAKNHINGVEQNVKFLTSQDGYIIKPQQDPQSGTYRVYIGPKEGIPAVLPLHIGDAIHNLNGVMDYLWSGLARSVNPDLASKVTFPRHKTLQNVKAGLTSAGHNATIIKAIPQAKAFILDEIKPYEGGNTLIWCLNKLDNTSKHRLLIPTTNIIGFKRDLVIRAEDGGTITHRAGASIKTNGPNLILAFATPFEFNNDAEPTIDVIFGEQDVFGGEPVLETLVNLVEAVSKVIQTFEKVFL